MPKAEVLERNPSKFEKEEDMSNLSILNRCYKLVTRDVKGKRICGLTHVRTDGQML